MVYKMSYKSENEKIAEAYSRIYESDGEIRLTPEEYNILLHKLYTRAFSTMFNNDYDKEITISIILKYDMPHLIGKEYPRGSNPRIVVDGLVDTTVEELVRDVTMNGWSPYILKGHPGEIEHRIHTADGDFETEYSK